MCRHNTREHFGLRYAPKTLIDFEGHPTTAITTLAYWLTFKQPTQTDFKTDTSNSGADPFWVLSD